jgi:hypothetical protein
VKAKLAAMPPPDGHAQIIDDNTLLKVHSWKSGQSHARTMESIRDGGRSANSIALLMM